MSTAFIAAEEGGSFFITPFQVAVLHLSWEEFQLWKTTPKLIDCAAASSRGKISQVSIQGVQRR